MKMKRLRYTFCLIAVLILPFLADLVSGQQVTTISRFNVLGPHRAEATQYCCGNSLSLVIEGSDLAGMNTEILWTPPSGNTTILPVPNPTPTQLNFNPTFTEVSEVGPASVQVRVWTDEVNFTLSNAVTFTINPRPMITTGDQRVTAGVPFSIQLAGAGGTLPYSWYFTTTPPPGLSLSPTGLLEGTITTDVAVQVQLMDDVGVSEYRTLVLTTTGNPAALTSITPNAATEGCCMDFGMEVPDTLLATIQGSNLTNAIVWLYLGGETILSLDVVTPGDTSITVRIPMSSPMLAGTYPLWVETPFGPVGAGTLTSNTLFFTVNPQPIVTSAMINAVAGVPFSQQLTVNGGTPPYTWLPIAGLPYNLTLSPAGVVSGTVPVPTSFEFEVQLTDMNGAGVTVPGFVMVMVNPAPLAIVTSALPPAQPGVSYSFQMTGAGGLGSYIWSASGLPAGFTFTSSGLLSGSPSTVGTFPIQFTLQDMQQQSVTRTLTLAIGAPLSMPSATLPAATASQEYIQYIYAQGGMGSYTYRAGTLPDGLRLTPEGALIGTPTRAGAYTFDITVSDTRQTATGTFTLEVKPAPFAITTQVFANAILGRPYSQTLRAGYGTEPYTWSTDGALPPGLGLAAATGVISGTPTKSGLYRFSAIVKDAGQSTVTKSFSILVVVPALVMETTVLPAGTVGVEYAAALAASGGEPPYAWTMPSGGLPAGISLNGTAISGRPTAAGTSIVTLQVADTSGLRVSRRFEIVVGMAPLAITGSFAAATSGSTYTGGLQATGGSGGYQWSAQGLPGGLTIDSATGAVTGTPSAVGDFGVMVQVTDSTGGTVTRQVSLNVQPPPLQVGPSNPSGGTAGGTYTFTLGATGGIPPYQWSVSGSLPAGLTLNPATGVISGTPGQAGTFRFTALVTDSMQKTATREYTMTVGVPSLPPVSITGVTDSVDPGQQVRPTVTLASGYPLPVTGRATITFAPDGGLPDDPTIQFPSGGRTTEFQLAANATQAPLSIQTGTTAGVITIRVTLTAAGIDVTPATAPERVVRINRTAPSLSGIRVTRTTGGLEVQITGFSTTREITTATFRFGAAAGASVQTAEFTVQVGQAFTTWFNDPASRQTGGQFRYTQPFAIQGDTSAITSVTVTLSNSQGASQSISTTF